MPNQRKIVSDLMSSAKREARRSPSFCSCGTCRQAVFQADEILKSMPNGNCIMWTMMVAATLFTRAADAAHAAGTNTDTVHYVFKAMLHHTHQNGMTFEQLMDHFDPDKFTPMKGKS